MTPKITLAFLTIFLLSLIACSRKTVTSLSIPSRFSEQATKMEVAVSKRKYVSFGTYKTSKIKRGWYTTTTYTKGNYSLEANFERFFGVNRYQEVSSEKDKFQFSLNNGNAIMEVAALEWRKHVNGKIELGKNVPVILKNFSLPLEYDYTFNALITDLNHNSNEPWRLVIDYVYDASHDTTIRLFPYIADKDNGYVTNGKDSVIIRSIFTNKSQSPSGREGKMPFRVQAGYELRMDGGVSAIVDLIKKEVWFYNELEERDRLLLATISTALIVRRVKDVQW